MDKKIKICISTLLILMISFLLYVLYSKVKFDESTVFVEYRVSYGGLRNPNAPSNGYNIRVNSNKGKLSNIGSSHYENIIDISKDKILNLKNLINTYDLERLEKEVRLSSEKSVLDGSSDYITIYTEKGKYEIGGYMPNNKDFDKIKNKIFEIIGKEQINSYDDWLSDENKK